MKRAALLTGGMLLALCIHAQVNVIDMSVMRARHAVDTLVLNDVYLESGGTVNYTDSTAVFTEVDILGDLNITASFAGLLGTKVTNTFGGAAIVAGAVHQLTNDLGYWGLIGMTNSGSTIGGSAFINTFHVYNQGYADMLLTVDGNKDFVWYSDPTDSHDFTALTNPIMTLAADGGLTVDSGSFDAIYYANTYWDDLRVPLTNTKLNPLQSEPEFEDTGDGIFAFAFDTGNDSVESLHFIAQLPHSYKEGTDIDCHIHWSPSTTNTDDVVWKFFYKVADIGDAFPAIDSFRVVVAASGTALDHQLTDLGDIDGTGLGISAVIIGNVTRLGDATDDDFTGVAYGWELDFHYQIDAPGSEEELIKY